MIYNNRVKFDARTSHDLGGRSRRLRRLESRGLVSVSDTKMQAKAVIQHNDGKMSGAFVFHKNNNGGWVLDKVTFRSDSGWSRWGADVFQKVQ